MTEEQKQKIILEMERRIYELKQLAKYQKLYVIYLDNFLDAPYEIKNDRIGKNITKFKNFFGSI